MLGRWIVAHSRIVLLGGLIFVLGGSAAGIGLTQRLSTGGYNDPASESARATAAVTEHFGRQDADVVAVYDATEPPVDVARLRGRPEIADVQVVPAGSRSMVVIRLRTAGSTTEFATIREDLAGAELAGPTALNAGINEQVTKDVALAEAVTLPLLLILMVIVFRSAVAALLPLAVAWVSVAGSFLALRLLSQVTEVSVLAMNIVTLIGMGLAVDYALFVVTRFREEIARGRPLPEAVRATVATAGRTVAFSGLTVTLALATLLLCPQPYLRSMGFGGMAAVLVAMVASLMVLPALLIVLAPRSRKLRSPRAADGRGWRRLADAVMRRPVLVTVLALVALGVLAAPALHARFGGLDERVLPEGAPARVAAEHLRERFPAVSNDRLSVVVTGTADVQGFADRLARVPGVAAATVTATRPDAALITVEPAAPPTDALVAAVRAVEPPAGSSPPPSRSSPPGVQVLVGGAAAEQADLMASLGDRLPWMALAAAVATFVLLFLAFGSVLLPLQALAMNLISIAASLGAVTWAFQDAHLAGLLGFTPVGHLDATNLVLMLAVLFGLSTDYELFLLSRAREAWDATGDNTAAVAGGLARTGRVITSAALLLAIVLGGFTTAGITSVQMLGVGMVVAIVLDATVVRALLVPALMRLAGRANWWTPRPLQRLRITVEKEPDVVLAGQEIQ